ncbi:hypothetical protein B0H67DRAFT_569114 [Lasiosphaeris hirsuta]|uniref:Uncharacterized protein n=1 Tax=Lasiosphaeris hirsuta TaxID=260670 RepID=A0AA40AZM7_9PEZI|nr:hypothetical protein B0H67DRAFT_569114 [Lasiosphaeris hirsuta]
MSWCWKLFVVLTLLILRERARNPEPKFTDDRLELLTMMMRDADLSPGQISDDSDSTLSTVDEPEESAFAPAIGGLTPENDV